MNRRDLLLTAPAALVAGAMPVKALTGETIEQPFLHEIDRPVPSYWKEEPGDLLLVVPGLAPWDDTHLMRDRRFAAVQVARWDGLVFIRWHDSGESVTVSRERANELVAGHIAKRVRMRRGRWVT